MQNQLILSKQMHNILNYKVILIKLSICIITIKHSKA